MNLLNNFVQQKTEARRIEQLRHLMRHEALLGGRLFGPIPEGKHREFFCLDEHTWVWHEEWYEKDSGRKYSVTTRYDVRPNGVLKSQAGRAYEPLSNAEAQNLKSAINRYRDTISDELNRLATA